MLHVPDETTRNVWVAADLPRCRQNVLLNAIDRDTKCIAFSIILGNSAYTSPCKQRDVDAEILSETENVNEHRIQLATSSPSPATFANCLTVYATAERPALNTKRKIENQIRVGLAGTFAQYSSSEKITLIVTSLPVDLIKSVTSSLNRSMTADEVRKKKDLKWFSLVTYVSFVLNRLLMYSTHFVRRVESLRKTWSLCTTR
ncbi:hypothetical protein Y032_0021g245 [Ancylostoma ceylanicum]|uniref:Uncharacterized protein n=1 Tax=Ancylostoma ceylanicum TaxID=53326 RepID=A0A016V196_9BILA|nr:hypothetical protein Y032_0021g245 [Ancylostoma ceylanicum]